MHETVQPVVHKETIQPEVVHTTVPIHETHHAAAQHHGMSALPMKTLDEFSKAGGVLSGSNKTHAHEEYEGPPRPYNEKLATTIEKVLPGHHGTHNTTDTTSSTGVIDIAGERSRPGSGVGGVDNYAYTLDKPSLGDRLNPRVDTDRDGKAGIVD